MKKICPTCNKEFGAHKQKQVFCSNKCRWKSQRLPDRKCIVCWKLFHPSKSTVKTCSKECWYKSMSLWNRKCEYCWKEFTPEHSTNRFCSRECGRKANTFLQDILCPICWKKFKPKNSNIKCCSMQGCTDLRAYTKALRAHWIGDTLDGVPTHHSPQSHTPIYSLGSIPRSQ